MGSVIYYFSATGNSLTIARQIAKGLGDCEIRFAFINYGGAGG